MRRPFALLLAGLFASCAARQPITTLSASTDGVTLTYPTGTPYQKATDRAEAICATYGKRATPARDPVPTADPHWSTAAFYCLAP